MTAPTRSSASMYAVMTEWFGNPVIVLVALAVVGIAWKAPAWYGSVNQGRADWKERADKDRFELKEVPDFTNSIEG